MSKDPAFLWYDGDAARDVSHMNRLERGAYFDLVQAQRKFGDFTKEQAKKVLGSDFDKTWESLELVLSCENGRFFIEWVKESIKKRMQHSEKQRERIQKYWDSKRIPRNNHGNTEGIPLENEIENANAIEIKDAIEIQEGDSKGETKLHWLIEHWQKTPGTTHHRVITNPMSESAKRVSVQYQPADLMAAIDNYGEIMLSQDDYFGKYPHGFAEFFRKGSQKPAPFEKFLPERNPLESLKNNQGRRGVL